MSPIGGEATSGGVQGAGQVAGDGGQAVVYLAELGLCFLQVFVGLDAGQGRLLLFRVSTNVLPAAGPAVPGRVVDVEVLGLAVPIWAVVGGGLDGIERLQAVGFGLQRLAAGVQIGDGLATLIRTI